MGPVPTSVFLSCCVVVVGQERDLQPGPEVPTLFCCSAAWLGLVGRGAGRSEGVKGLEKLVRGPRLETWDLSWEASSPRRQWRPRQWRPYHWIWGLGFKFWCGCEALSKCLNLSGLWLSHQQRGPLITLACPPRDCCENCQALGPVVLIQFPRSSSWPGCALARQLK